MALRYFRHVNECRKQKRLRRLREGFIPWTDMAKNGAKVEALYAELSDSLDEIAQNFDKISLKPPGSSWR